MVTFNWPPSAAGGSSTTSLTTLGTLQGGSTGSMVYVAEQGEYYQLDATNTFAVHPTLVIAATGGGRWFRRSKAYVVGNFTMWVCPFGGPSAGFGANVINGYTPGQQIVAGTTADIVLDVSAAFTNDQAVFDVVVDNLNNIWVTSFDDHHSAATGRSAKYLLKDILASGAPTASVVINQPAAAITSVWASLGFDKQNNLWAAFPKHGTGGIATFLQYGQYSYSISGTPNPRISITLAAGNAVGQLPNPSPDTAFFAFDADGNLWAAIGTSGGGIFMISKEQLLSGTTSLFPAVRWEGSNFTGMDAQGLAFAPNGDLWVADYANSSLKSYDVRNPVSGNQAPLLTITSAGNLNGPDGICFDGSGNLWVANDNDSKVLKFAAADLSTGGAKTPVVVITPPNISFGNMIAFPNNPQRSGLVSSGAPITP